MNRRRRRSSPAEDLIALLSRVPWWAGLGLALVSYLTCRHWADPGTALPTLRPAMAALVRGVSTAGQFVLPSLCVTGAGLSFWRQRQRQRLMDAAHQAPGAQLIDGLSWQAFEQLVGEAFRRQGYQVRETGQRGADGGVDLELTRPARAGRELTLVQCKHWRAQRVGVEVLRQLYGVMAARGAVAGIVITSGRFSAEAQAFARGGRLRLIDGQGLQALLATAQGKRRA